jgi:hypothetical protein
MSTSNSRRFPVTVTYLPVTRCQICRRTVAYRPGNISEVLTEHYRRSHPEALGLPSRQTVTDTGTTPQMLPQASAGPRRRCRGTRPQDASAHEARSTLVKTPRV